MNTLLKILLSVLIAPCFLVAAQKHPNLVLIMAEDIGYKCLGANGGDDSR